MGRAAVAGGFAVNGFKVVALKNGELTGAAEGLGKHVVDLLGLFVRIGRTQEAAAVGGVVGDAAEGDLALERRSEGVGGLLGFSLSLGLVGRGGGAFELINRRGLISATGQAGGHGEGHQSGGGLAI